jgi:SPP1 gp7 family putative phage head morphogenesis protein
MAKPPHQVKEILLDRTIRHGVYVQRFAGGEVNRLLSFLDKRLLPRLMEIIAGRLERINIRKARKLLPHETGPWTTKRYKEMQEYMGRILADGLKIAHNGVKDSFKGFALQEAEFQRALLETATQGLNLRFLAPSVKTINTIVKAWPYQGATTKEWFDGLTRGSQLRLNREIKTGIALGETNAAIMRRIRGRLRDKAKTGWTGQLRREAEAIVRTGANSISNSVRMATYAENEAVIKGYRWVSILDAKTTPQCAALDNRVFQPGDGPQPPIHWNCRSQLLAVTKTFKELGIPLSEPPLPKRKSYGTWLKDQPLKVQKKVLGATGAKRFRKGEVKIERFVHKDYTPLTQGEIRALESDLLN